jgi:formylglycine-generating enzyme required for sulfatase activity
MRSFWNFAILVLVGGVFFAAVGSQSKGQQTEPSSTTVGATFVDDSAFKPQDTFKDCDACPVMVVIPAGTFLMVNRGSVGVDDVDPAVHHVTIPNTFAVSKYEVTQIEWQKIVGWNESLEKGDDHPVEKISWANAQLFVKRLSAKTGKHYRLLSGAEWEYAARAGTTSAYWWGNDFDETMANIGARTKPVGQYSANAFGLHDMHGNVWEWVEDCWNESHAGLPLDGTARTTGNCIFRVIRGGSIGGLPRHLRSDARARARAFLHYRFGTIGLRVARSIMR